MANPKQWVGSLTSMADLRNDDDDDDDGLKPTIRLHIAPSGEVYYASWSLSSFDSKKNESSVNIDLVPLGSGPYPALNRPIVVNPDGGNPEEVPEKTFVQK